MSAVKALSKQTFKSLHIRNYRVFFTGQLSFQASDFEHDELKYWFLGGITNSDGRNPQTFRTVGPAGNTIPNAATP